VEKEELAYQLLKNNEFTEKYGGKGWV